MEHWKASKRVLRYFEGTKSFGLVYSNTNAELTRCNDAYDATNTVDRKSTDLFVFIFSGACASWRSNMYSVSAEATVESG